MGHLYRPDVAAMMAAMRAANALLPQNALAAHGGLDAQDISAILDEVARFSADVLAPLNRAGDQHGAQYHPDGTVTAAPGFKDAYGMMVAGGWQGVSAPEAFGGMGLSRMVALSVFEMMHAANMAFGLCPMLTLCAIDALIAHGSAHLQTYYLPKLVTGEWSGTMCLTEPQAGSDVGALTSRAVPQADGSYRLFGTKIFITWGEHDAASNIVHMVLARLPDAPEGTKGISLFLVPKFFEDGAHNDVRCLSIEHKMGIHASPTCVMGFGADGVGATAFLVGEPHKGMRAMFTMMNAARLNVGIEGVGVGEAAFQHAHAYAQERVQGVPFGREKGAPIAHHPDVARMLAEAQAHVTAARILSYACAGCADAAAAGDAQASAFEALLTPVAKVYGTEAGMLSAHLGVQVHGGMGFIEETGAAQFMRDARIAAIYEGTNGIQANDFVLRKLGADNGAAAHDLLDAASQSLADTAPDSALGNAIAAGHDLVTHVVGLQQSGQLAQCLEQAVTALDIFCHVMGGVALAHFGDAALYRHYRNHCLAVVPARVAALRGWV